MLMECISREQTAICVWSCIETLYHWTKQAPWQIKCYYNWIRFTHVYLVFRFHMSVEWVVSLISTLLEVWPGWSKYDAYWSSHLFQYQQSASFQRVPVHEASSVCNTHVLQLFCCCVVCVSLSLQLLAHNHISRHKESIMCYMLCGQWR